MAQRSRQDSYTPDDESDLPERSEGVPQEDGAEQHHEAGVVSSPIDFYEAVRNRPDIKEILTRLARS